MNCVQEQLIKKQNSSHTKKNHYQKSPNLKLPKFAKLIDKMRSLTERACGCPIKTTLTIW